MSLYHLTQIYAHGKRFEREYDSKAEALYFHNKGLNNPKVLRSSIDEYDTSDPFNPVWKEIIDVIKERIPV